MKTSKLLGLQILRGFAAWFVVMHHLSQEWFNWKPPFNFLKVLDYGSFGVDIFFVLSGFIMYYSVKFNRRGGIAFFLDRFFRVFPVYWFMTLLLLISYVILPLKSYNTLFTWDTLLKSLALIPSDNPSGIGNYPFLYVGWTLTYEMFFYVMLSVSLLINKKRALMIASICLSILPVALMNIPLLGHSNLLLYEFVFGVLIAHVYTTVSSGKYKNLIKPVNAIPLFIVICISGLLAKKFDVFSLVQVKLIIAGLIVVLFLLIENIVQRLSRVGFLVLLGDISYSTYLIHPVILGWFRLLYLNSDHAIIKFSLICLYLCLVFFLSNLSFRYIEINRKLLILKEKIKDFNIFKSDQVTPHNNRFT